MFEHNTILDALLSPAPLFLQLTAFPRWLSTVPSASFLLRVVLPMQADSIPSVSEDGATVRVMAGQHNSTVGPIKMRNPGLLMDVTVEKGGKFVQEVGFWGLAANEGGQLQNMKALCGLTDCAPLGNCFWPRASNTTPALSIPALCKARASSGSCRKIH